MQGVVWRARELCHLEHAVVARVLHAQLLKRDRKAKLHAEVKHLGQLVGILQHQLGQRAKRDLLAVVERVRLGHGGKAVVDGVCRRKARRFEAKAREQRVGLNDLLDRLGACACLERDLRLHAVGHQRVIAQARKGHGRGGHLVAGAGRGVGTLARARLEVRRQRVTHAAYGQANGALADDLRVHEHEVRVRLEELVLLELTVIRVHDGKRGARSVGRGNRRHHYDGRVYGACDCLGRVEDLAATDANDDVRALLARVAHKAVNLGLRALAVELVKVKCDIGIGKALLHHIAGTTDAARGYDDKGLLAVACHIAAELCQLPGALNVLAGTDEHACHNSSLRRSVCKRLAAAHGQQADNIMRHIWRSGAKRCHYPSCFGILTPSAMWTRPV